MEKDNKKMYAFSGYFVITTLAAFFLFGAIVANILIASEEKHVLYVSQEEILDLERKRIEGEDLQNRKMFLGKPSKAAMLIQEFGDSYKDNKNLVVYSVGKVAGSDAESLSEKVYNLVIEELQSEN